MATITSLLKRHPVRGFYALVFAISWGGILLIIEGPGAIPGSGEQIEKLTLPVLLALFAGPSTAGIVMTRVVSGRAGLHKLLSRLLRWRVGARWYAAAVLFAPVLVTTVLLALTLISPAFMPAIVAADDKATLVLFGIGWGLVGGGLLEELGWTGFAVPMLRRQYGALTTALVVGLLWGVWHILIALWMGGCLAGGQWTPYVLGILAFYLIALPAYRVLLVWVHDRTDSLLVVMLMHASLSASTLSLQPPLTGESFVHWNLALAAALCVVIAAIVVAGGWRMSPRPDSKYPSLEITSECTAETCSGSENRCTSIAALKCSGSIDRGLRRYRLRRKWTLTQPRNLRRFSEFGGSLVQERTAAFCGVTRRSDHAPLSPSIPPPTGTILGTVRTGSGSLVTCTLAYT